MDRKRGAPIAANADQSAEWGVGGDVPALVPKSTRNGGNARGTQACRVTPWFLVLSDPATAGKISLRRIASNLYISPGYLSRIFHQATGTTLERFVMIKRVELAKKLLLDPAVSVASVSNRCGFSEPTYLTRVFRKLAGCSPSEYARNPRP
jgi:AraC-like DNA-binding protein